MANVNGSGLGGRLSFMSDNIVLLDTDVGPAVERSVTVIKCRGTAHDLRRHALEITAAGASVKSPR